MQTPNRKTANRLRKEIVIFLALLPTGLLLLPVIIYYVGKAVFGAYEGSGFMTFFGRLYSELLGGELVVWFLVLSPYLVWQTMRLTIRGFRRPSAPPR